MKTGVKPKNNKVMKNMVAILLMFSAVTISAQDQKNKSQTKIAIATYVGSSSEGFYFTNDLDESSMLFAKVRPEVTKVYDLNEKKYMRETFRVTYNVEKKVGMKLLTIIGLELLDYDEEDLE